eukprot:2119360-Alexandrium_andersonii.AAC.1
MSRTSRTDCTSRGWNRASHAPTVCDDWRMENLEGDLQGCGTILDGGARATTHEPTACAKPS